MDKRVVFAVAGSGKTTRLINELDLHKRVLLLTYTENNCAEIRRRVIRRFGHVPDNVTVSTYFTFLNSFCYRPLLLVDLKTKGISFERPDPYSSRQKTSARARYVTAGGRIYHSRMARALDAMGCMPAVLRRLERYYDMVCVDEVQDFGGHDFTLLLQIASANIQTLFVGDFFQHTYSTSTDGNVKQGLHDSYERFQRELRSVGLIIDTQALQRSHRCSATVCEFIRDHIGIEIHPAQDRQSRVHVVEDVQQCARAVSAAIPWMRLARGVDLVSYSDAALQELAPLKEYLQQHGIDAVVHDGGREHGDAPERLLSLAADLGSGLLVMGCWGHSRIHEWATGGMTRSVLASMTLPVLMVH